MSERGIKPEHECFDLGHVGSLARWSTWAAQAAAARLRVMGMVGGIPPTARNLAHMADKVPRRLRTGA